MAAAAGPSGMQLPGLPPGAAMQLPGAPPPPSLDALLGPAGPRMMPPPAMQAPPGLADMVAEFEAMGRAQQQQQQQLGGPAPPPPGMLAGPMPGAPPPPALTHSLRAFLTAAPPPPMAAAALPPGALSVPDQCRVRDRSTILARQLHGAERGQAFADAQVAALLASLAIDPAQLPSGGTGALRHVHDEAWHAIWQQQQQGQQQGPPMVAADLAAAQQAAALEAAWREQQQQQLARPWQPQQQQQLPHAPSTGWVDEFAGQQQQQQQPQSWAEEFTHGEGERWAGEFEAAAASAAGPSTDARGATSNAEAMAATRRMVDVLSADANPKMRDSQFLRFLSKMSRGELLIEEGGLKEVSPEAAAAARQWADEFEAARAGGSGGAAGAAWAADFAAQQQQQSQQRQQQQQRPAGGDWADEFARGVAADLDSGIGAATADDLDAAWAAIGSGAVRLNTAEDWAHEFGGDADAAAVPNEWDALYAQAEATAAAAPLAAGRREYAFADPNPFLGDAAALAKGKELFRRGLLTEAALALEAEVRARPGNAEAWRLLGTVHAENDDDGRAIAAMGRALEADPDDRGALLALGVSHVNELDRAEAVGHLRRWLLGHPVHGAAAAAAGPPPDSSQLLSHTLRAFTDAAARGGAGAGAADAELLTATGVLQHLARDYDGAIASFRAALELSPGDYSLWNKLGATLANHSHSGEAIGAYQRALDLKV